MSEKDQADENLTPTARRKKEMTERVDRIVSEIETRRAGKRRPVLERICSLYGRGNSLTGEGFGGLPTLTDQDVAAALAMVRKDRGLVRTARDIGPEILETYYGSTDTHRSVLRAAYVKSNPTGGDTGHAPCRRMAATIASQMIAGMVFSRKQEAEFAYICHTRLETMRTEIAMAVQWFHNEASEAAASFRRVIDSAQIVRMEKAMGAAGLRRAAWLQQQQERLAREQREREAKEAREKSAA